MNQDEVKRIKKNNQTKSVIGILLFITIAYFLISNFSVSDIPMAKIIIKGESKECAEIRAPKTLVDTELRLLNIEDIDFKVQYDKRNAEITLKNTDNTSGEVTVRLYCLNEQEISRKTKKLLPEQEEVFVFENIPDCDLRYQIQPETITQRVNKTVYTQETSCE